jgi:hypothetical protein
MASERKPLSPDRVDSFREAGAIGGKVGGSKGGKKAAANMTSEERIARAKKASAAAAVARTAKANNSMVKKTDGGTEEPLM